MLEKKRIKRAAAVTVTVFALVGAAPQPAMAKVDNLWKAWATAVTDRSMFEVPFAVLTSFPALLISTPFWFGVWTIDKIKHRAGDDSSEAEKSEDDA